MFTCRRTKPEGRLDRPDGDTTPAADSWVEAGNLVKGRSVTRLVVLDETAEVVAVGDDVACGLESEASDSTELYDMATGVWRSGPRMPSVRHGPAVAALPATITDDGVLVTGGSNQEYVAKSSTVLYDANARAWSRSGLLNTARIDPAIAAATALGPHGWMAAGELAETPRQGVPTSISVVATSGGALVVYAPADGLKLRAEWFDAGRMAWSPAGDPGLPAEDGRAATMVTLRDGRVLVVSGLALHPGTSGS